MAIPSRRSALAGVSADGTTHAGLWFDAMLAELPKKKRDGQQGGDRDEADVGLLREHLDALAGRSVPAGYEAAVAAREAALRAWSGTIDGAVTRVFEARAEGRVVVGLGAASLVETNIALQRTWGVPYIPGSALKGLASSTAHRSGDVDWQRAESGRPGGKHAQVLFGDTTTAGVVTFHDAWWVPTGERKLPLDLDVMTVHHADYYMKGAVPADWDSPNPVAFVTSRGTYLVVLTGPAAWVELAFRWLELGLARDGIGAKTHAGYGRMILAAKLSPEEKAAKAAAETVRGIAARYTGPGNRREIVGELLAAQAKGADVGVIEAECRALYAKGAGPWKDWLKDPARTPDEKALFAWVGTVEPSRGGAGAVPVTVETLPWLAAQGWIARDDRNRETVYVRLPGRKPLERQTKDVEFVGDTRAALTAGAVDRPVDIEVQVRNGDRIKRIRAPGSLE